MAAPNQSRMTKHTLTRRELARQALAGTAGALLASALTLPTQAQAQVVDPAPAAPPPLPAPAPTQIVPPMNSTPSTEGQLLTQLVPVVAGYALSDTQAKEVTLQLKDYPGGFAKARAYTLPDDIAPAFAADPPFRKERVK